ANVPFFALDIPRLLLYAFPPFVHLALLAVDRVLSLWEPRTPSGSRASRLGPLAWLAAAGAFALCVGQLDPYRRVDLRGPRDGRLVLALCRESLAFGRRLEAGRPVTYDIAARGYDPSRMPPSYLERMRWFLRT